MKHKREDLFIAMMEVVNKHFQDDKGTASECAVGLDASKSLVESELVSVTSIPASLSCLTASMR